MSTIGLFAMGVLVTLLVGAALGLLFYGAILDGRYAAEHNEDEAPQQLVPASSPAVGPRLNVNQEGN